MTHATSHLLSYYLSEFHSAQHPLTHHEEVAAIADRASSLCGGTILKTADPQTITRFFRNHCQECSHPNEPAAEETYA